MVTIYSMFDKAKMIAQAFKIKKALESQIITIEEDGMLMEISASSQIKKLVIDGVENKRLMEFLNKALKKSQEYSAKQMQAMGMGLDSLKF